MDSPHMPKDDSAPITRTVTPSEALPANDPAHTLPPARSKQASYGALISIVIILAIVVVGAFYSWGKRVSQQQQQLPAVHEEAPTIATTTATSTTQ